MQNTLIRLAEIHYEFGFIDYDELNERIGVALWLCHDLDSDPRLDSDEATHSDNFEDNGSEEINESVITKIDENNNSSATNKKDWLEFLCLGVWVFTKSDADSYPSIPHGHFRSQNRSWPKLNPYTGRVFSSKHQEDSKQRLSRKEMWEIWSDEKFKSFCREMIIWYMEEFPHYKFPVTRTLRMPRW